MSYFNQRDYDNALPPSYYAPDEDEDERYEPCYYCGENVELSPTYNGGLIVCDKCEREGEDE